MLFRSPLWFLFDLGKSEIVYLHFFDISNVATDLRHEGGPSNIYPQTGSKQAFPIRVPEPITSEAFRLESVCVCVGEKGVAHLCVCQQEKRERQKDDKAEGGIKESP